MEEKHCSLFLMFYYRTLSDILMLISYEKWWNEWQGKGERAEETFLQSEF